MDFMDSADLAGIVFSADSILKASFVIETSLRPLVRLSLSILEMPSNP
jgi:hypothetical protein